MPNFTPNHLLSMKSKILTVYVVFFSGLFLAGCNSNFEFNDNESKIENKIDQSTALIDESMIQAMKIDKNAKKWAIDLYNLNKNHAFWIKRSEERRVGKECRSRWSP